jgi:predicted metal-binding protein
MEHCDMTYLVREFVVCTSFNIRDLECVRTCDSNCINVVKSTKVWFFLL